MFSIDGFRLDVETAGIEADAFADQRHARMTWLAPFQIDQPRRPLGSAADGMNQRKVLGQEIVADDHLEIRPVARGQRARGCFQFRRPHVVGRRVDEIARQCDRLDDALEVFAVNALRRIELGPQRLGLAVAGEAIRPERKGKRGQPRVVRIIGKAVNAIGQLLGQPPGEKRIVRLVRGFEPEQDAAEPVLAGQREILSGLRLETRRIGECARAGGEPLANLRIARRGDEPDRSHWRGSARRENRMHRIIRTQRAYALLARHPAVGKGDAPH